MATSPTNALLREKFWRLGEKIIYLQYYHTSNEIYHSKYNQIEDFFVQIKPHALLTKGEYRLNFLFWSRNLSN